MLTNVCIEVGVVDQESMNLTFFHEFEKRFYCLWNKQYNDNCDQAYFGVRNFHEKLEPAIYNMD